VCCRQRNPFIECLGPTPPLTSASLRVPLRSICLSDLYAYAPAVRSPRILGAAGSACLHALSQAIMLPIKLSPGKCWSLTSWELSVR
jgi:hypothetical protein